MKSFLFRQYNDKYFLWVVVEKELKLMDENFPNIGFVGVNYPKEEGGKWEIFHKRCTKANNELKQS